MLQDPAFSAPGRFWKGNLHTHSTRSDGVESPETVCALYRERGYDFLALTDHFLAQFDFPVVDTTPYRRPGFTTLLGAELHAPSTVLGETWHIVAAGLPLDFAATRPDETGPMLAARALKAGAFVAIAHPDWYGLTLADADAIPGAHAIEVYNHSCAVMNDRGGGWTLADQLHVAGRRITACATDDAHFDCDDAFGGWVMVKAEANEPASLLAALKAGNYYASQGPQIHGVHYGEAFVDIECSPASAIMVLGRGSRAQQKMGTAMTSARLPLASLRKGNYARVVIIDADGRRAWTNPVWW